MFECWKYTCAWWSLNTRTNSESRVTNSPAFFKRKKVLTFPSPCCTPPPPPQVDGFINTSILGATEEKDNTNTFRYRKRIHQQKQWQQVLIKKTISYTGNLLELRGWLRLMQWWAVPRTGPSGKLHDRAAIIQLNIHQNIPDKTSLFLCFLRLCKIEIGTSSQYLWRKRIGCELEQRWDKKCLKPAENGKKHYSGCSQCRPMMTQE